LGDPGVDGRIILRCIFRKLDVGYGSEPDCRIIVRQSGSDQSLTENKTSRTFFFLYY
jgi:hypothetical protein